jgi:transcriptional regulator with XRE-family HTH domain
MERTQVFEIAAQDAIGGKHFRAARTLLDWTKREAAENCGVGVNTIGRIESDEPGVGARTIADIVRTFGEHGIVFVKCEDGSGVVLKSGDR